MINKIIKVITAHPHSIGESYARHWCCATQLGIRLMMIACCLLIHAILPCFFVTYARDKVAELHDILSKRNPK